MNRRLRERTMHHCNGNVGQEPGPEIQRLLFIPSVAIREAEAVVVPNPDRVSEIYTSMGFHFGQVEGEG